MSDRPILFSAPMVRALLDGRKTQTRRILKPQPEPFEIAPGRLCEVAASQLEGDSHAHLRLGNVITLQRLPVATGDRLWVREKAAVRYTAWHHVDGHSHSVNYAADENEHGQYIATHACGGGIRNGKAPSHFPRRSHMRDGRLQWCPSIHMPRWASRLTLTVKDVRVQRLQDISEADAIAEGMTQETAAGVMDPDELAMYAATEILCPHARGRILFQSVWDHINGPGSWEANPWVAAYSFTVHRCNIDQMEASHD